MTDKAGDQAYKNRYVVGFVEPVQIADENNLLHRFLARVDSGATRSSIDKKIVEKLNLGPVIGKGLIRNANGQVRRDVIKVTLHIGDETYTEEFTVADRGHLNFPVLIGRNILTKGFLIDPEKSPARGEEE